MLSFIPFFQAFFPSRTCIAVLYCLMTLPVKPGIPSTGKQKFRSLQIIYSYCVLSKLSGNYKSLFRKRGLLLMLVLRWRYGFVQLYPQSKGKLEIKLIFGLCDFSCHYSYVLNTEFTLSFQMSHYQLSPFTPYMKLNVQSKNICLAATNYYLSLKG